jgi:lactoylglutathione lyase
VNTQGRQAFPLAKNPREGRGHGKPFHTTSAYFACRPRLLQCRRLGKVDQPGGIAGRLFWHYDTVKSAGSLAGGSLQSNSHLENAAMRFTLACFATILTFAALTLRSARGAEGEFSSATIDLGVVTSDIAKSVKFYTEAIGFKELKGFSVGAEYAKDVGLTDGHKLDIHVLALGDEPTATKLKLMSLPGVDSKRKDQGFIHSTLGYSYITIHITDTTAALERLKKAGVKPIAKSPLPVPKDIAEGIFLTIVRDPDGNFIELVGPKK